MSNWIEGRTEKEKEERKLPKVLRGNPLRKVVFRFTQIDSQDKFHRRKIGYCLEANIS